jgi:hypothetical protein
MRIIPTMLMTILVATGVRLAADTVETADGVVADVTVASLDRRGAKFADGRTVATAKIRRILFARFPVAPQPRGVVLRDGTRLCGTIREWADPLRFRSVSLGELTIPRADLAAVWYQAAGPDPAGVAEPQAIEVSGTVHRGRILWADAASVGVRTDKGLQRLPTENLAYVVISPVSGTHAVTLRNGDVINFPASWQQDAILFRHQDREYRLPLAAVQEIIVTPTGGKNRP